MTDRPAAVPPEASRTDWWMVMLALGLGALAAYQQFKLPPVLPLLLERYGYERIFAGGFMSIYAAVGLALSAVIGVTIERQGFRRALIASCACFLVGSGLTGRGCAGQSTPSPEDRADPSTEVAEAGDGNRRGKMRLQSRLHPIRSG